MLIDRMNTTKRISADRLGEERVHYRVSAKSKSAFENR